MSTELIVGGKGLQLPDPRSPAAASLWSRLDRLPDWIPAEVQQDQFMMAVTAEANRMPQDVNPASLCSAAFNCAVVGLMPGPALGHAHFVPFKSGSTREVQLIVGYKGYLELAYRSGFLAGITCEVVYEGEKCERWNDSNGPQIDHRMSLDRVEDFDKVVAAYCIYQTQYGYRDIVTVGGRELKRLKQKHSRGSMQIWRDNPIEMALKTPIRRAAKRWKLTNQMAKAVYLDEQADRGERQASPVVEHAEIPKVDVAAYDEADQFENENPIDG